MKNEMHDEDQFNAILVNAVDNALLATGEILRQTIYELLEERKQVKRDEIPVKLQAFHDGLHELLGRGAGVIERQAMMDLYCALDLRFINHGSWTLVDYVEDARRQVTRLREEK
jgi:type II secretory pathway predicted ATPase ExeA